MLPFRLLDSQNFITGNKVLKKSHSHDKKSGHKKRLTAKTENIRILVSIVRLVIKNLNQQKSKSFTHESNKLNTIIKVINTQKVEEEAKKKVEYCIS